MNYAQTDKKQAEQIITNVRRYIVQRRGAFLDSLYALQFQAVNQLPTVMTTDGVFIYYSPRLLVELNETEGMESVAYGILHLCSHCLLGHLPGREQVEDKQLFDVLADYKVHKLLSALWHGKKYSKKYRKFSDNIALDFSHHPLPVAYRKVGKKDKSAEKYLKYADNLRVDAHQLWNSRFSELGEDSDGEGQGEGPGEGQGEGKTPPKRVHSRISSEQRQAMNQWKKLAQKMLREDSSLGSVVPELGGGKESGTGSSDASWEYEDLEESESDYTDVLEQFFRKAAVEVENIDEIDPMWYHFGLDYLEDIPIIEPTEELERPCEGTLVIAIDTSGSCQHSVCDHFLSELSNMMNQLEVLESVNRVVLYQCDDAIQEELVMESPEEWKKMVDGFQLKGGGCTDFRPVFKASEQYEDMVGLIYLSDCLGDFPKEEPEYETLFLMTEEDYEDIERGFYNVPSWLKMASFSY